VKEFLFPQSVSVVGASPRPESIGGQILLQLLRGFRGRTYAVNPKYQVEEVGGREVQFYREFLNSPGPQSSWWWPPPPTPRRGLWTRRARPGPRLPSSCRAASPRWGVGTSVELFDAAKAVAVYTPAKIEKVLVVSSSGGMGVQITDALNAAGLSVACGTSRMQRVCGQPPSRRSLGDVSRRPPRRRRRV
jgi:hypothetical protein